MENFEDRYQGEEPENKSINEIFREREKYIPEIGEQLRESKFAEVEINGEKLNVDYRVISVKELEREDADPVLVLCGFGSGWEGSELPFSLACEGRKVISCSLPGYGNSDTPSKEYSNTSDFLNEAEVVNQLIGKLKENGEINPDKKVHVVGHSMGGVILAELAEKHQEEISSLTLLSSAGIEEKEKITMPVKFIASGAQTVGEYKMKLLFSGEKDYEDGFKKYIPKTKSPFTADRIKQRLSETSRLMNGRVLEILKDLEIPVAYMAGELDAVFPPVKTMSPESQWTEVIKSASEKTRLETSVLKGLRHNTTVSADEITAANIDHYLDEAEKINKVNINAE